MPIHLTTSPLGFQSIGNIANNLCQQKLKCQSHSGGLNLTGHQILTKAYHFSYSAGQGDEIKQNELR